MSEQAKDGAELGMELLARWKADPALRRKHESYTAYLKFEREERRIAALLAACPPENRDAVEKRLRKGVGR